MVAALDGAELAERFSEQRGRLTAVAYRMLGSSAEAEDAVQETWLRLAGADSDAIENLAAWLTTVVSRVCLTMLRSRQVRREEPLEGFGFDDGTPAPGRRPVLGDVTGEGVPEAEAELADSVGLAMLVVLDTLGPAERVAFVLHDMFDVPFEEIAPLLDRNAAAARQLASRARRRVRGTATVPAADLVRQRLVVDAYMAASRAGDFHALVALLDPDVVLRVDADVLPSAQPFVVRGAATVAKGAQGAVRRVRYSEAALVDGRVGLVMAPAGRLALVLVFTFDGEVVTGIDIVAEPERLAAIEVAVLEEV